MANVYKRWLCDENLKTLSSRPILIYFQFRSKPSLVTVIWMDPHSPKNFIATNYCFLILGDDTSFFFFLCFFIFRFYVMLCYVMLFIFVIINFCKNCFLSIVLFIIIYYYYYYYYYLMNQLIFFFHKKIFLFFHVPGCSGMFHVPGFIDAQLKTVLTWKPHVYLQGST